MSPTINSSEITAIIKSKIENYSNKLEVDNVGLTVPGSPWGERLPENEAKARRRQSTRS